MGRLVTILFAWRLGTNLEPEAKYWRLAADVFNDVGMILDCVSPIIPTASFWGWYVRVGVLSSASVLRALCGVAAGSSKATLSQHFAVEEMGGNIGELNAVRQTGVSCSGGSVFPWLMKSSPERFKSRDSYIATWDVGMFGKDPFASTKLMICIQAGSLVLSFTKSRAASSITLAVLLCTHITMNYLAVRSVCMKTLNRQRTNIVFSKLYEENEAMTPVEAAKYERVFERDGVLRWAAKAVLGRCRIGVSMKTLLQMIAMKQHHNTGAFEDMEVDPGDLLNVFKDQKYLLWLDRSTKSAVVVLKTGATVDDQLKGWTHALLLAKHITKEPLQNVPEKQNGQRLLEALEATLLIQEKTFSTHLQKLQQAGWDLKTAALETRPGNRIALN